MDAISVDHDPFRSGDIVKVTPSTEPQREILAAAALSPEANTAYNEAVSLRITGSIDTETIERALYTLVHRHDALRSTFTPQLDALCVTTRNDFKLERISLMDEPAERQEHILRDTWRSMMRMPMPLCEGPLFRARWLQLAPDRAELILLAHHAVCDGWSFHVLLRELAALCSASPPDLPPAPSFAAFAEQQQVRERDNRDGSYWLQRFADRPPALDLPTDKPRPPRRTFAARRVDRRFDPQTSKIMAAVAGRLRASSVGVLLAAVAALLHRLTDGADITLGLPIARQALDGLQDLVGHCVQLLPIRLRAEDTLRFEELVAQARTAVLDASDHFDFTFGSLVRGMGLSGDASRVPLIPVLVNVDQPLDKVQLGSAIAVIRSVPRTAEGFEIFLNVVPSAASLVVEATFNSDLFADETIEAWLAALESLLVAGGTTPTAPIRTLQFTAGSSPTYGRFNATERPVVHGSWLEAFAAAVQRSPQAPAALDANGAMTYAELSQRARELARALIRRGVHRGSVVGMSMTRSRELLVAMAGIHLAGAAHLPLDPAFPEARLRFMLEDAGAKIVVTDTALPAALEAAGINAVPPWTEPVGKDEALPAIEPRDLAYVIYTSGSTGRPKGVRVPHGALANVLASVAVRPGFGIDDTLLAITTVSFDISLLELLLPITVGGRVVVATRDDTENPRALASLLKRHGVTVMQATPATWRLLVDDQWPGSSSLVAFCGGEQLPRDLAAALLPRVHSLWNLYGPTETTVWSAGAKVTASDTAGLVGTPFDNTRIFILDRAGTLLPPGVPGEICIGGLGLAEGYQNLPQLTAERFFEHLELGRLYRTGDRGRVRPSGTLECLGRMDQQVKVRGFRIELGEIEAVLTEHAAIAEAAVALSTHEQNEARIVAYVVGRATVPAVAELKAYLRTRLPDYMVPHKVVVLTALPRLPNGKIDRRSLPRASAIEVEPEATVSAAPETPTERLVAAEMCAVLGVDRIGVEQDFFEAGGHSLLAAQLVARLNRACDAELSMRTVFEAPTPRRLAHAIAAGSEIARSGERQIPHRTDQHLSPVTVVQERIWFMEQMLLGRPTYNLPSAHRLRGPLDEAAFAQAFAEIVRRQSALRTTFERRGGRIWQIVHDHCDVSLLPCEDLSELPAAEREAQLMSRLEQLTAEPFRLGQLPLFAARLFRLAPEEHVLFFMPHHIIWDGWSFDILYEEMAAIYGAAIAGQPSPLPELPISYGDFAAWHREILASPDAERQAGVWRERLRRFGPVQPLPVDRKRGPSMSGHGATEWMTIDAARTRALHQLGRDRGATLFITTLAIYSVLLHDYARESRLLLATPVRGRESMDLESVMGCCNSLAPLCIEVGPDDAFEDIVARVKSIVLDSLAFRDVVLEQIADTPDNRDAGLSPTPAGNPVLYQALFSFQDVRRRRQRWGALDHSMIHLFQKGATEDLGLWFVESEAGLQGGLTHNSDVLMPATARRLRDHYLRLVDAVILDPAVKIASLVGKVELRSAAESGEAEAASVVAPYIVPANGKPGAQAPGMDEDELKDLEFILTRTWQRVLGVEQVGLHDSFFELGGNSLAAIRCVSEFESATGITIDLGQLFRTPTIAELITAVGAGTSRATTMLIPLQAEGSGAPLFCLLGIWVYRHLAKSLGKNHPVYGIYAPDEQILVGTTGKKQRPAPSVDRLASAYVDVITKASPRGPLRLAGLSYGGVVAMEVARRLTKSGVQVECVVLLDSLLPTGYQRNLLRWAFRSTAKWGKNVVLGALARTGLGSRRRGPAGTMSPAAEHAATEEERRLHGLALESEVARWMIGFERPSCPVILLRAKDTSAWGSGYTFLPDYGWGKLLGDRLTVILADGNHLGMLMPPHVTRLSEQLRLLMP